MPGLITSSTNPDQYGQLTNQQFKVGKEDIDGIMEIFGKLPKDVTINHLYSNRQFYGTIQDALNERIATQFKSKIYGLLLNENFSPMTDVLYPWQNVADTAAIDITWDEMKFDEGIADLVAPLGIPRLYSHTRVKRGDRMLRKGAAIYMEDGFYKSPEGRAKWKLQIRQIAAVVQRTCEYDVICEMLQAHVNQPKRAFQLGYYNDSAMSDSYMDYLQAEIEIFGLVNKTPDGRGLVNTVNRFRDIITIANGGVEPDTLVLPPNLQTFYLMNNDSLYKYSEQGPQAYQNQKLVSEQAPSNGVQLRQFLGYNVIDTKIRRVTSQSVHEAGDLLTMRKQIGEWYPMYAADNYTDVDDFKYDGDRPRYTTSSRNIQIFNEYLDMFTPVRFRDALASSSRWNVANKDAQGEDMWSDSYREFVASCDEVVDMFMFQDPTDGQIKPVTKWSQISSKYLNAETKEKVTASNKNNDGWLESSCNWATIEQMLKDNVHIPVTVLLFRPGMTFATSTGFICKAGTELGRTFFGHSDFQMSNNTMRKAVAGSYTFYSKAITLDPLLLMGMEDFFIQRYLHGSNCSFYDENDIASIRDTGAVESGNSILSMVINENWDPHENPYLDIRGKNNGINNQAGRNAWLFDSADFYNYLVDIDSAYIHDPTVNYRDYESLAFRPNTVCCRGFYEYGKGYEKYRINTGHLGQYIYNGCAKTRNSHSFIPIKEYFGSKLRAQVH